jgi:hypothetical protein
VGPIRTALGAVGTGNRLLLAARVAPAFSESPITLTMEPAHPEIVRGEGGR